MTRTIYIIVAANRSSLEIYTPRVDWGKLFRQVSACQLPATSVLSEPLKLTIHDLRYPRHVLEQPEKMSPSIPIIMQLCEAWGSNSANFNQVYSNKY